MLFYLILSSDFSLYAQPQAGASIAGILNFISSDRYITDNGVPRYDLDYQPAFPSAIPRQLRTGPMPHLATPGWWAHVQAKLTRAWAGSPIVGVNVSQPSASGFTAPLLLVQVTPTPTLAPTLTLTPTAAAGSRRA